MRQKGKIVWCLFFFIFISTTITNFKMMIDTNNIITKLKYEKYQKEINNFKLNFENLKNELTSNHNTTQSIVPNPSFYENEFDNLRNVNLNLFSSITPTELDNLYRELFLLLTKRQKICDKILFVDGKSRKKKFQRFFYPLCFDVNIWNSSLNKKLVYSYELRLYFNVCLFV